MVAEGEHLCYEVSLNVVPSVEPVQETLHLRLHLLEKVSARPREDLNGAFWTGVIIPVIDGGMSSAVASTVMKSTGFPWSSFWPSSVTNGFCPAADMGSEGESPELGRRYLYRLPNGECVCITALVDKFQLGFGIRGPRIGQPQIW